MKLIRKYIFENFFAPKKFKIVVKQLGDQYENQVVIVLRKYKHSITKEIIRDVRIDSIGIFGTSLMNFKTIRNDEYKKLLSLRVKDWSENMDTSERDKFIYLSQM